MKYRNTVNAPLAFELEKFGKVYKVDALGTIVLDDSLHEWVVRRGVTLVVVTDEPLVEPTPAPVEESPKTSKPTPKK